MTWCRSDDDLDKWCFWCPCTVPQRVDDDLPFNYKICCWPQQNAPTCIQHTQLIANIIIMTSSNGNIFRVTGPLQGESTGDRWIPLTKACNASLWCFLWSMPEQTIEQTIAGDLRCHCARCDVTAMIIGHCSSPQLIRRLERVSWRIRVPITC